MKTPKKKEEKKVKTRTKKQILKSAGTLKESYSLNQLKVKINRQ